MKSTIITLCLLISLMAQAQIEPLLDHVWQLEKIVIEDEVVDAQIGLGDEYPFLSFEDNNGSLYFYFDNLDGFLDLSETNQEFTVTEGYLNFGDTHGTEAASLVVEEFFLSDPHYYVFNNPFSYLFREEAEFLYLDITNSNGDVATFFTTTLSNTNFDKVELTIYPNPTSNLLHIETKQTDVTAVEIFDLQGKSVKQVSLVNETNINVSDLANGMYFIKIATANGQVTRKFVKK